MCPVIPKQLIELLTMNASPVLWVTPLTASARRDIPKVGVTLFGSFYYIEYLVLINLPSVLSPDVLFMIRGMSLQ